MEQNEENVISSRSATTNPNVNNDIATTSTPSLLGILLQDLRNKQSINLSNKNLEEIPKEVFSVVSLTYLNLSHNQLTSLPSDIKHLVNLIHLDVSSNKISTLPNELGLLTKLEDLILSDNPLPKQIKLDHFRGILLSNLRDSIHQPDSLYANTPNKQQPKRSNTVAVIRRPDIKVPVQASVSVSSFNFVPKASRNKYTKDIREKKNEWKKKIICLQMGDEHKSKTRDRASSVEHLHGPPSMNALLRMSDSSLPTFLNKKPREDKWLLKSKAYRGTYNLSHPCTVRTIYLKKDEKVDFYRNLVAGSELNHPNVCQIIGVIKYRKKKVAFETEPEALSQGNVPILVISEIMSQGTLHDWLRSSEVANLKKVVSIAKQIAQGMQQLHNCKIIHHNLKTSNILFTQSWSAKITDFYLGNRALKEYRGNEGIGLRLSKSDEISKEEKEEAIFKCPFWIAPELWRHQPYDEKVDVYSFGYLLWELLTKQIPFNNVKSTETLIHCVCDEQIRPAIPESIPKGLSGLISMCWDQDPALRPNFQQIVSNFDDLLVDSLVEDVVGRKLWKRAFGGQPSVCWTDFLIGFNEFFKLNLKQSDLDESVKSLHDVIVDSDEVVTIENFAKMTQWFGPMVNDGKTNINNIHQLQSKSWFHGNISSIQAEDMLSEKAKGTYLVRFSSSNPGSYAISVNTEESVKHYKIWHKPGGIYSLGKEKDYKTLDELLNERQEQLNLRFSCPKGERYSDSNFWVTSVMDENETKTVVSLKKLCFRFVYRNQHLFPSIKDVIPVELTDEFRRTLVDSITSDELGRELWKSNFLGKESISFEQFAFAFFDFLRLPIEPFSLNYKLLYAITKDIADNGDDSVTIENFSKLLEWFGPMSPLIMEKIRDIVTKEWFHGNLTHVQAERIIQKSSNAKKGTFLIRFSSKNRGYFTVTVVGRKRSLLHYRVYYNRAKLEYAMGKRVFKSLEEILRTYHRELCLRTPCPGSKFQGFQLPP